MTRKHLISLGLIALVALASTLSSVRNAFVWDDVFLEEEQMLLERIRWPGVFFLPKYWNEHHATPRAAYRPLREASMWLDVKLWGLEPTGHRVTMMVLHLANSAFIYFLGARLFMSHVVAVLAAVLFAAHPIHTESLAMVKNRGDLMGCLFLLIGFVLFVRAFREGAGRRGTWHALSVAAYAAAILSKSMAVTLPALLVVHAWLVQRVQRLGRLIIPIIPFLLVVVVFFGFKRATLNTGIWAKERTPLNLTERVGLPSGALLRYGFQLAFPVNLHHDQYIWPKFRDVAGQVSVLGGAAILAALGLVRLWRRSPPAAFACLWMLLTVLPVSNIIPLRARPVAEQRLYIPSVGWVLFLGWLICKTRSSSRAHVCPSRPPRALLALGLALVLPLVALSCQRYFVWRNSIILWSDAVVKSYDKARSHNNLGAEYSRAGHLSRAERSLRKCLRISSAYADAHANLGMIMRLRGQDEEALNLFRKAILNEPDNYLLYARIANSLSEMGHEEEALEGFRAALRLSPNVGQIHNRMGQIYLRTQRHQEAIAAFQKAVQLEPNSAYHFLGLGRAYQATGEFAQALAAHGTAIRLSPTYMEAHFSAGECFQALGNPSLAAESYKAVLQLDPNVWRAHANLGAIYEQRGEATLAAYHYDMAVHLNPALLQPALK
ncbi:MAG: tetratricopeptide repeat protein [Planctomycetes bacterium]|nr:tetratricopeptide repeat protein [Planctomycetota bacterium]